MATIVVATIGGNVEHDDWRPSTGPTEPVPVPGPGVPVPEAPTAPAQYTPPPDYTPPPADAMPRVYSAPPMYSAPPVYSAPVYPTSGPYGGYPVAPVAPRKRRTGLVVALVIGALLLGAAAGSGVTALVLRPGRTVAAAAATTPATPSASPVASPTGFTGDLRELLLPMPSTAHPYAKPLSPDGTLTEQQIAAGFKDPERAIQVLEEDGFVSGAIVQWHDADDTEVSIRLYEFDRPEYARSWQYYNQDGYSVDLNRTNQSPIDGIADSGCFVTKKEDSDGFYTTNGIASRGTIYMNVFVYQYHHVNKAIAIDIMQRQYAKLP